MGHNTPNNVHHHELLPSPSHGFVFVCLKSAISMYLTAGLLSGAGDHVPTEAQKGQTAANPALKTILPVSSSFFFFLSSMKKGISDLIM